MRPTHLKPGQTSELNCLIEQADKAATPFFEVPFELPEGVTRLDVNFSYAKADDCILDIGILDSSATGYPTRSGFRGWSGSARNNFFIGTDAATPGYNAGTMPGGIWTLLFGLYRVPLQGVKVTLKLRADATPRAAFAAPKPVPARRDAPGWYRGDLHCHTHHSDAKGSPGLLHETARGLELDFLAVTDHNTTSQWQYFGPNSTPDLIFVPGMEVTTYRGHANLFGLKDWIDFRLGGSHDLDELVAEARRQGALLSVNHDKEPLPWDYDYPDMDCMEVYHGHWLTGNDRILTTYDRLLGEGRRISLIGSSDYHQPAKPGPLRPFGLGTPTTVLWLSHLDADAIVDGLRSGCGFVTESPTGPHLSITVDDRPMGSVLYDDGDIDIRAAVNGAAGDRLVLTSEQGPVAEMIISSDHWLKTITLPAPSSFLRAEIVADRSRARLIAELVDWYSDNLALHRGQQSLTSTPPIRRALSNPIYFEAG